MRNKPHRSIDTSAKPKCHHFFCAYMHQECTGATQNKSWLIDGCDPHSRSTSSPLSSPPSPQRHHEQHRSALRTHTARLVTLSPFVARLPPARDTSAAWVSDGWAMHEKRVRHSMHRFRRPSLIRSLLSLVPCSSLLLFRLCLHRRRAGIMVSEPCNTMQSMAEDAMLSSRLYAMDHFE